MQLIWKLFFSLLVVTISAKVSLGFEKQSNQFILKPNLNILCLISSI